MLILAPHSGTLAIIINKGPLRDWQNVFALIVSV